jgi:hypothetical protein
MTTWEEKPMNPEPTKIEIKDTEKRPSLMIATPMYGGMCTGHYVSGLLATINKMRQVGVPVYWAQMMNESLITRARNELARLFLEKGYDYLMFIDADISFDATAVAQLMAADRDIACGIYPKKLRQPHRLTKKIWKTMAGRLSLTCLEKSKSLTRTE